MKVIFHQAISVSVDDGKNADKETVVLAVQDRTYVDYTHHRHTEGLGILSDHQGMLLHTTLAVTREPLGLIDQQIIYRDPTPW